MSDGRWWRVTIFGEPNRRMTYTDLGLQVERDGGLPVQKRLQYYQRIERDGSTLVLVAGPDYSGGDLVIEFPDEEDCDEFLAYIPAAARPHWERLGLRAGPPDALGGREATIPARRPEDQSSTASEPEPLVTLARTSAQFGAMSFETMRTRDLVMGWLYAVRQGSERRLMFRSDSGVNLLNVAEDEIVRIDKVTRGFNTAVEVVLGKTFSEARVVCFVGARGRMKEVCAALGHPI